MAATNELRSFYDRALVEQIAEQAAGVCPGFDPVQFVRTTLTDWSSLSLMQRSRRIASGLKDSLPDDYPEALEIVLAMLGPDDGTGGVEGFAAFRYLPLLNFVGMYGLDHPDRSLAALGTMTKFFSAEFDIRPYILRYPDLTFSQLHAWAEDDDWRLRRLASEGSRPRLPWGLRLKPLIDDPSPSLAILDRLKADPHPVVRRSVANHLNDIAKDHPDLVIATARRWLGRTSRRKASRASMPADPGTLGIVRHALRTLVKQGNPDALELLGFEGGTAVAVENFRLSRRTVVLGESLEFSGTLVSNESDTVVLSVDYRVHHRKANGALSPKTFKLTKCTLAPGERHAVGRRHAIVPITTRRYYAGRHQIEIVINGHTAAQAEFVLKLDPGGRQPRAK